MFVSATPSPPPAFRTRCMLSGPAQEGCVALGRAPVPGGAAVAGVPHRGGHPDEGPVEGRAVQRSLAGAVFFFVLAHVACAIRSVSCPADASV